MSEAVLIVLEPPPSVLSPNRPPGSFGGRMRKAAAAKRYRRLAREAAEEQLVETAPWERVAVSVCFYHKQKRRRDDVNYLAMLKPAYDGFVDAGLLVDDDSDHLVTLGAEFDIDRKHPRVEILIERRADV